MFTSEFMATSGVSSSSLMITVSYLCCRQQSPDPSVGTRLEGLLLDELDDDFNPRAFEQSVKEQKTQSSPVNVSPITPPMRKCSLQKFEFIFYFQSVALYLTEIITSREFRGHLLLDVRCDPESLALYVVD